MLIVMWLFGLISKPRIALTTGNTGGSLYGTAVGPPGSGL